MSDDLFWGLFLLGVLTFCWLLAPLSVAFLSWMEARARRDEVARFDADEAVRRWSA